LNDDVGGKLVRIDGTFRYRIVEAYELADVQLEIGLSDKSDDVPVP
jgi:hypothetical protein